MKTKRIEVKLGVAVLEVGKRLTLHVCYVIGKSRFFRCVHAIRPGERALPGHYAIQVVEDGDYLHCVRPYCVRNEKGTVLWQTPYAWRVQYRQAPPGGGSKMLSIANAAL